MRRKKFLFVIGILIAAVLFIGGAVLTFLGARNFDMLTDPTAQPGEGSTFWEWFLEHFDYKGFFDHLPEGFDWSQFFGNMAGANVDWGAFFANLPENFDWGGFLQNVPANFDWGNFLQNVPANFDWGNFMQNIPEDFDWGNFMQNIPEDFDWEGFRQNVPEDFDWNEFLKKAPKDFDWDEFLQNPPDNFDLGEFFKNPPENFDLGEFLEDPPENFDWGEFFQSVPEDFDWSQVPWNELPEDFDWSQVPWDKVPLDQLPPDFPWNKVPWGSLAGTLDWTKIPWDSMPEDFDWSSLPWPYLIPLAALGLLTMPWDRVPHDAIPDGVLPDGYSPWANGCTHTFTPYVLVQAPTCGDVGIMRRTCTICRYSESYSISETGEHDFDANLVCNNCHRRKLVITSPSAEKVYDGTPLSDPGYEIDWAHSAASTPGHTVVVINTTSITDAGRELNRFSVAIRDASNSYMDVGSQYAVIKMCGTLTVTRRAVTVITGSAEKVFDGTPLTCEQWEIDGNTPLVAGDALINVTFEEGQTQYGSKNNVILSYAIYNMDTYVDVTKNYEVTVEYGTLTVKHR